MTDASVQAIAIAAIAAVPATLVALAGLIQGRKNGAMAVEVSQKQDVVALKADIVAQKTDIIEGHVNGNLRRVTEALNLALAENEELKKSIAAMATKDRRIGDVKLVDGVI